MAEPGDDVPFGHYLLQPDHTVKRVSLIEYLDNWAVDRLLFVTQVGDASVSTIFLGIDPGEKFRRGAPLLFETMIFGGRHDHFQMRWPSYDAARIGHHQIVQNLQDNTRAEDESGTKRT